ncbi:protein phosphatase 2A, regulatory subunit, putative [Theileria equi strain WA]|uniref:Protein phosphatase 2A, regulatory subunit, putative n=1 Tax=Theileria equi strain WA TaxID=1537102 RepID=L0AY96_THEEQ|nr:protein phosphatase 2A, regulatory subunit, putative [Theileria equi strain WA]AFZ80535.1 protein phosphatase 2A, regulatory subunit, putative [Theileria equi strain WA]|eukprot:XP_004830201.1 protein phosphatase 2A, regulatory subunit, putative [Theileria equi strain WA]
MRLFRSTKDKASSGSDNEDSQPSNTRSDNSPQKSLFRSMGLMFSRSPNRGNDVQYQRLASLSSGRLAEDGTSHKTERKGWFSRFSDSSSMKCESVTSKSIDSGSSPPSHDDVHMLDRSSSYLSLSPLSLKGVTGSDSTIAQPIDLQETNFPYEHLSKYKSDRKTIVMDDEIIHIGSRFHTSPVSSNEVLKPFEIKHAASLNLDNDLNFDHNAWMEERKEPKQVEERGFFNIRNKLSSFQRNLSTPRAFKFMSSRSSSKDKYISDNKLKRLVRGGANSDGSDNSGTPRSQRNSDRSMFSLINDSSGDDAFIEPIDKNDGYKISAPIASCRGYNVICLSNTQIPEDISSITPTKDLQKVEENFSSLPLLKDTPLQNRPELFQRKLIACQTIVDFDMRKQTQRAIELKRQILLEIVEYISTTRSCINERILQDVIDMVAANVFRSLPQNIKKFNMFYDSEDDEPALEKSWPHLQIVYDIFLRVIVSTDITSKMAKNVIDRTFVLRLLSTLNSEDQRERDYLKTILHRIYGKIVPLRNFIRKAIDNVFTHFVYDAEVHYGITELLEILGSIINGFAIPLKEEHKIYLRKALAPLHKPKSIRIYHAALTYCMIQYINKDRTLSATILKCVLNYWPTSSTQKEILFLNELEEVLSLTELTEFNMVVQPLVKRLALCLSSTHFQVAERTLYLWNNDRLVRLFNMNKEITYAHIVPILHSNASNHWNSVVRTSMFNVSKILLEYDQALYNKCIMEDLKDAKIRDDRTHLWNELETSYKAKIAAT